MERSVSTLTGLRNAFANANDGDVIKLAPGDYGWFRFENRDFAKGVTVTSADPNRPAVFDEELHVNNVSGLTLKDIEVAGSDLASSSGASRLFIRNSEDISLVDMKIEGHIPDSSEGIAASSANRSDPIIGLGYEIGLRAQNVDGLEIKNVEFTDLRSGISLTNVKNATLDAIEVHGVREGINMNDVEYVAITDSYFHDFEGFRGDHPDMIQYWGVNSKAGVHHITIDNNLFVQPSGWTQTIFGHMRDAPNGVTATDFTITNNTIVNGHVNGIRLGDVTGFEISGNLLLANDPNIDPRYIPAIYVTRVADGSIHGNSVVERNISTPFNLSDAELAANDITAYGNVVLPRAARGEGSWVELLNEIYATGASSLDNSGSAKDDTPTSLDRIRTPEPAAPDSGVNSESSGGSTVSDNFELPSDLVEITGTSGNDVVRAWKASAHLKGLDGNDFLYERDGDDVMTGGAGADRFILDFRASSGAPSHDIITDLDFSEGDRLGLVSNSYGAFDDSADPSNRLMVFDGGSDVQIRSIADLKEAEAGGGIIFDEAANGSLMIRFADDPRHSLEIWTLEADDFLL